MIRYPKIYVENFSYKSICSLNALFQYEKVYSSVFILFTAFSILSEVYLTRLFDSRLNFIYRACLPLSKKILKGGTRRNAHLGNFSLNFFFFNSSFLIRVNLLHPSSTIFGILWFDFISLVFSFLSKVLLSGILQFKGNFGCYLP